MALTHQVSFLSVLQHFLSELSLGCNQTRAVAETTLAQQVHDVMEVKTVGITDLLHHDFHLTAN
jgi:hypothetical protein